VYVCMCIFSSTASTLDNTYTKAFHRCAYLEDRVAKHNGYIHISISTSLPVYTIIVYN
jgi:hypothetical protein